MTDRTLQTEYGKSAEYDLRNDLTMTIKPAFELQCGLQTIEGAIIAGNLNGICSALRVFVQTLHLPQQEFTVLESFVRDAWKKSPKECIRAMRHACLDRGEQDFQIRSTQEATLHSGTHFVDVVMNDEDERRKMTINNNGRRTSAETSGDPLRAKVSVGPEDQVRLTAEHGRLVIFSILQQSGHRPLKNGVIIQSTDPTYARYLDDKKDTFLAGRHFAADMLGDPSWHELKMAPNSDQKGYEHVHPHARLVYVTHGSGILETGVTPDCADQTFELQPGKLIVLTAGSWHRFSTGPDGLTVHPVHPVTPTSGASANNHEMFNGTWSSPDDVIKMMERGATH